MCRSLEEYGDKRYREGYAEGFEEGLAEVRAERTATSIRNVMETLNFSFGQAIAALKIPEADRSRYAQALANR